MNSGGYLPSREAFTDTEVNNCFSIYHTSWITSGPKSNFICGNIPTKAILFFFSCSEVNSTWLITSELANQRARKALFTCVVYTNKIYRLLIIFWHEMSWRNKQHMPQVLARLKEIGVLMSLSQAPHGFFYPKYNVVIVTIRIFLVMRHQFNNTWPVHIKSYFWLKLKKNGNVFTVAYSYRTLPVTKKPLHYLLFL